MSVEVLPEVYLELPGSSWPPASDVTPSGVSEVSSWSYDREIVGKTLPGQVRARSGLSIGDASVSIRQPSGKPMTPWAQGDRLITTGGRANLFATKDGPASTTRTSLGGWIVDPASGSLLSPEATLQLIEAQYAGRRVPNALPLAAIMTSDPAWMVAVLARQAGFHNVPPPVASCLLAVSASGSMRTEVGFYNVVNVTSWDRSTGPISPVGLGSIGFSSPNLATLFSVSGQSRFLTLNATGTVTVRLDDFSASLNPTIELRPGGVLAVRNRDSASWVTTTYTPGLSPAWPMRVEVEMQRTGSTGSWSSFRARARSGPDAAWSAWATSSVSSNSTSSSGIRVILAAKSSFSGLQVSADDDRGLWTAPTADIDPLGGTITAPWLPGAMDPWTGIQEICAAYCGISWVSNDRTMKVRSRSYVAGNSYDVQAIDVDTTVKEIPWTIDPDDTADRLVVTYNPVDFETYQVGAYSPVLWSAPDVLVIAGGATIDVIADCDGLGTQSNSWLPVWDSSSVTASSWSAFNNREGTGTHVADTALTITSRRVSAGRVVITVVNNTAIPLYLVDANGAPCLILRSASVARQANELTIERGLTAATALNELTVDLGRYVQNATDANTLADFIWSRVSQPTWKASQVQVKLDWYRDMGQIVTLAHPASDLAVKALVVGIHMSGSDGSTEQFLDLVLLPPTWFDFDQTWATAGTTWTSGFDAVWSGKNWSSFDSNPTKTA